MPLFFIVAGYTIRSSTGRDLTRATWKDFRRLYVPVLLMRTVSFLGETVFYGTDVTFSFWDNTRRVLWGNGNDYTLPNGVHMYGVDVLWFLIALFWSKLFYRLCLNKIKKYRSIFILFLALAGMGIGSSIRLPQCLDLIPVIMLFMEGGYQLRHCGKEDVPAMKMAGVAGSLVWIYLTVSKGIYIELAGRSYPGSTLSVVVAFVACLAVFQMSKALEGGKCAPILAWLGKNSMDLLCIHYLDRYTVPIWYIMSYTEGSSVMNRPAATLCRVILDVAILFVWWSIKKGIYYLRHYKKDEFVA